MNWKTVGTGFMYLCSMILIPFSWFSIIFCVGTTFGDFPGLLSFAVLVAFSVIHFIFQYKFS